MWTSRVSFSFGLLSKWNTIIIGLMSLSSNSISCIISRVAFLDFSHYCFFPRFFLCLVVFQLDARLCQCYRVEYWVFCDLVEIHELCSGTQLSY